MKLPHSSIALVTTFQASNPALKDVNGTSFLFSQAFAELKPIMVKDAITENNINNFFI